MDELDIQIMEFFFQMTAKQKAEVIDFVVSLIASGQEEASFDPP